MTDKGASNLLLFHDGELTPVRTGAIFDSMKKMAAAGVLPKSAVRVVIELVQNVRLHGGGRGSVRVSEEGGIVEIETSNRTSTAEAARVLERVREANSFGDSLPEVIRRRRFEVLPESARGAGLGILEVRKHCCCGISVESNDTGAGDSCLVMRARLQHK